MPGQLPRPRRTIGRKSGSRRPVPATSMVPATGSTQMQPAKTTPRNIDNVSSSVPEDNSPRYEGSPSDVLAQERQAPIGPNGVLAGQGGQGGPGYAREPSQGASGIQRNLSTGSDASPDKDSAKPVPKDSTRQVLQGQENDAAEKGGFFKPGGGKKKKKSFVKDIARKRMLAMVLSLVITFAAAIAAIISTIMPLKALTFVSFLESKVFAAFNSATSEAGERMLTSYIKNRVMPSLAAQGPRGNCASTLVNRSCAVMVDSDDPIENMMNRWGGAGGFQSLENKLALRGYVIELRNGQYFMTTPDGGEIDLTEVENGNQQNVTRLMGRAEVRANFRQAFEGESFMKRALFRYRVGAMLETRYGIKRCVIRCDVQDRYSDSISVKKRAFQAYFIRRFVEPRSATMGVLMNCMFNVCDDTATSSGTGDPNSVTNGEPTDEFDRQSRAALARYRAQFGSDKLNRLVGTLTEVDKAGSISRYATTAMVKFLGSELLGRELSTQAATRISNPVGWVLTVAKGLYMLEKGSTMYKRAVYTINGAAMVSMFYMFLTAAEEFKTGHMDAEIFNAVSKALNSGYDGTGLPIEASPLFDATTASATSTPVAALVKSVLPQKAHAQAADGAAGDAGAMRLRALCNDGTPVQANQEPFVTGTNSVCPELRYGKPANMATEIMDYLTSLPVIAQILGFVATLTAWVLSNIVEPLEQVAGAVITVVANVIFGPAVVQTLETLVAAIATEVVNFISSFFIPSLIPENHALGGDRIGDLAMGGGHEAGAASAHSMIGGQKLTVDDQIAIEADIEQRENERFATKSLYARMFDTNETKSFISQVALATPGNPGYALQSAFASIFANPIGTVGNFAAGIAAPPRASAQAALDNPFGVTQYGVPLDDPFFDQDPVEYYNTYCKDGVIDTAYNTDKTLITDPALVKYGWYVNPQHGQRENDTANPCFLVRQIIFYDQKPSTNVLASADSTAGIAAARPVEIYSGPDRPQTAADSMAEWNQTYSDDTSFQSAVTNLTAGCGSEPSASACKSATTIKALLTSVGYQSTAPKLRGWK